MYMILIPFPEKLIKYSDLLQNLIYQSMGIHEYFQC